MPGKSNPVGRLPDWRSRLTGYLVTIAHQPFRPGCHDCALFVAGAIAAMTGCDPAARWRGGYRSLRAGRARLAADGYADMTALAATLLFEVPPILAQAGDVAVVAGDDGDAFGLVQGSMIYVLRPTGLGLVPLTDAKRAFRV